jgi:hypothetical protein
MKFRELQFRLLDLARRRIRNGAVTERGLARLSGLSQPHIHNSLKNIRALSLESTDRLMEALGLTIGDLLCASSGHSDPDAGLSFNPVPFLRARIGPGSQPAFDAFRGFLPVAPALAAGMILPVAGRLASDLVLPRACAAGDIVLLDQNPVPRACPLAGVWVTFDEVFGMRVRYARLVESRLFVFHEANFSEPAKWDAIPLKGRSIPDIVRARVVWIIREMDQEAPTPLDPAGGSH